MRHIVISWSIFLLPIFLIGQSIQLHPDNPHYFIFRGKPTILLSSGEHYGALLNLDFDYRTYLNVLADYGFNQTRIFSGVYCEGSGESFLSDKQITWEAVQNPLAPRPKKLVTPWARSDQEGYRNGGNKFDLDVWDPAYFERLRDFCTLADEKNIIVEIVLFSAFYKEDYWLNSPLNPINNVNGTENIYYNEFHLINNKKLVRYQIGMVKKIVEELNNFDNVYFEICNEPYWLKGIPNQPGSTVTEQQFLPEILEWEMRIANCISEVERRLPKRHLIAMNIANHYREINYIDSSISVLNFHYAFPPSTVYDNYSLGRPIAFDETVDGTSAPNRRREAWAFILSGGAVYSNLDWSFAIDDPLGLGRNAAGNRTSGMEVRGQLQVLNQVIKSFDYVHAQPMALTEIGGLPENVCAHGLKSNDASYLCYFYKEKKTKTEHFSIAIKRGRYKYKFMDPLNGKIVQEGTVIQEKSNALVMAFPCFSDDLVLKIIAR